MKFILRRNFQFDVNQQCSTTRWTTLYLLLPQTREFEKELEWAKVGNKDDPYKPSYLKALVRTFGMRYMLIGLGCAFEELFIRVFQASEQTVSFLVTVLRHFWPFGTEIKLTKTLKTE